MSTRVNTATVQRNTNKTYNLHKTQDNTDSIINATNNAVTNSTIALLQADLTRTQQEVQNLRSVLHTFSANADSARADGRLRLEAQAAKHAHALHLLTTEMVAAQQKAAIAEAHRKKTADALNATIEQLTQELVQSNHSVRMAEARTNEVENAEMIDRRLVRKVLLQYVSASESVTEDPVDLLAVILGLNSQQRSLLSDRRRGGVVGDTNSGVRGMTTFLSDVIGL